MFYSDSVISPLPVEKQTGSEGVQLLNQLSTGSSTSTELVPGSFWWDRAVM